MPIAMRLSRSLKKTPIDLVGINGKQKYPASDHNPARPSATKDGRLLAAPQNPKYVRLEL